VAGVVRAAVLALVVGVSACTGEYAPDPARTAGSPPPAPTTSYLVKETALLQGRLRVRLAIPLAPPGPKPTLISLLGDQHPVLAAGFVAATYTVIHPPKAPADSGTAAETSAGKWVLASPSAAVLGESYLREIATTATTYVPALIDWLATVPEVDVDRLGMVGASTNGFVTLQAAAADERIGVVVAIAACGDYHGFLRDSSMGMGGAPLALAPAYQRWLERQEVARHPERLTHAAVLMIDRTGDELIPIGCADVTAEALRDAFARAGEPERFRYVRLEEAGHGMSGTEVGLALGWFQQWLGPR